MKHSPWIRFYWQQSPRRDLLLRDGIPTSVVIIILGLARWLTPSPKLLGTHQQLGLPPCVFYVITGHLCPSCGATTSFSLLMHGQWITAFHANFLAPFWFAALALYGIASMISFITQRHLSLELNRWVLSLIILLFTGSLIAYGIWRFHI